MSGDIGELSASWQGTATDASAVERALGQMLRDLNPPAEPNNPHPRTRASVLNLIVHSRRGPAERDEIEPLLEVSERHPSRTLVLATDSEAAESGLDAAATARCRVGMGSPGRVCFEEVRLVARGALADHPAAVVAPLLVPDLPVVLWWPGEPPAPEAELPRLCDQLIVESAGFGAAGLDAIGRLIESLPGGRVVGDLTWWGLAPWREHLAQLFDAPTARVYQREITSARLRYVAGGSEVQPLLLLGWLATRLGWMEPTLGETTDAGERAIRFGRPGGIVEVRIIACTEVEGCAPGELGAVTLESRRDERAATFEVCRDCGNGCASQRVSLPDQPPLSRVVPIAAPSLAARFGQELARAHRDPSYEASLQVARALASR